MSAAATSPLSPEEAHELRRMVRDLFARNVTEAEVRRLMATSEGVDAGLWATLAELGLTGLTVPERLGGAGAGMAELSIVMEEAGRTLACVPLLSSAVLCSTAILASGDGDAAERYLPRLCSGTLRGTVAMTEPGLGWAADAVATTAEGSRAGWRLRGRKTYVLDGSTCDLLVVSARTPRGVGLFAVDAEDAGVERRPLPTLDLTRKQAEIRLNAATGVLLGEEGRGAEILMEVLNVAGAALAVEQVGGAQRVTDMAADHARTRMQFGRAIGSFQAVKHHCANMLIQVELARSAAYHAVDSLASGDQDRAIAVDMAKAYCSDAYYRCAATNIQVHGGIGFTWEHPAHLYLKRAKSSQHLFGTPRTHRRRIAAALGLRGHGGVQETAS